MDSSDSDFNIDLFSEKQESDLLSSEDNETPFARHGPLVDPDHEEIAIQRNFWNLCVIGFILDYRKFSRGLQLNFISVWVQFHGLPLECQYPELAKKLGHMMGLLERVDWEDKIPRDIRFMRVKVKIDPLLLVIAGFMLRLDDGSRVWIKCRYERVHNLCTKCGLIGHTRGQCTHCMEDIEVMLYRQRLKIQDLHQV
ncbi:uncharacterized protein LOC142623662 [Castanea sativa]|uniref:uncharacterized protein LOC142623662 n=1 Tax=Castanea sativa TaxID=21020 RepID=UPI003F64FFDA